MKSINKRTKSWWAVFICGVLLAWPLNSFGDTAAPTPPQTFTTLQPGGFRNIAQNLPINIVFVGYEEGAGAQQINQAALQAELPNTYRAINRISAFYGNRTFVGTTFNYNYNYVYADTGFEDAFFGYLSSIAQPQPRTYFQDLYNAQNANSLDVTQNHWIDAPSVEKWLANNASGMLGIDPAQYTVFLINWHGRSDFKFHVYTKTDEPDPDTGVPNPNFNQNRMIAWGGTTPDDAESGLGVLRRIWFYDLSAGPDFWTGNWNVDDADLYGDGVADYRVAPVWEYGNLSGYRPFDNLSGDLGKVVRYVAIDSLFTTSPFYKPAISAPRLPTNIQLDINLYQGDPSVNARDLVNTAVLTQALSKLQPLNSFTAEVNDQSFSGRAAGVYDCWLTALNAPFANDSCYGNRLLGYAYGDLFLYNNDHLLQFLEGDGDYEIPVFVYSVTADRLNESIDGFADDNWRDGTQSMVFIFQDPVRRGYGFGATHNIIHEVGHHLGMSHPHDGYDFETDNDFSAYDGQFWFAWAGDYSNTVMNYLSNNHDFSQFNRDNMNRYLTATYINQSNTILPRILSSPRARQVSGLLATADAQAASALSAYGNMDYLNASALSKAAYQNVLNAAAQLNVPIEPQASQADYRGKGLNSRFVDRMDRHRLNMP